MTVSTVFKAACHRVSFLRVKDFDFRSISPNSRKDKSFAVNCTLRAYLRVYSAKVYSAKVYSAKAMPIFSNFFYFWDNTLHVSDGLSVHHQEFKTVHTATGICQTGTATCLLASRRQYLLLYVRS
jgi:hypothetical protein